MNHWGGGLSLPTPCRLTCDHVTKQLTPTGWRVEMNQGVKVTIVVTTTHQGWVTSSPLAPLWGFYWPHLPLYPSRLGMGWEPPGVQKAPTNTPHLCPTLRGKSHLPLLIHDSDHGGDEGVGYGGNPKIPTWAPLPQHPTPNHMVTPRTMTSSYLRFAQRDGSTIDEENRQLLSNLIYIPSPNQNSCGPFTWATIDCGNVFDHNTPPYKNIQKHSTYSFSINHPPILYLQPFHTNSPFKISLYINTHTLTERYNIKSKSIKSQFIRFIVF